MSIRFFFSANVWKLVIVRINVNISPESDCQCIINSFFLCSSKSYFIDMFPFSLHWLFFFFSCSLFCFFVFSLFSFSFHSFTYVLYFSLLMFISFTPFFYFFSTPFFHFFLRWKKKRRKVKKKKKVKKKIIADKTNRKKIKLSLK